MSATQDGWVAGSTYEDFMGRWSRRLAPEFVSWLSVPAHTHWLDVGCGTGALTAAICEHADPASVLGCDPAAPFVEYANQQCQHKRASFVVAGAGSLPPHPNGYGSVSSLLALNFFPNHAAAVAEMASLVQRDGTISACVWDYAGKMEFLRYFWDAVVAEDPGARDQDEGVRFPVCDPDALTELFRGVGLTEVSCDAIDIATTFDSFNDYWGPLLGGTGPAAAYVTSLDETQRDTLVQKLEQALPRSEDGAIALIARAWAVRGTVS
jgi:SAM-dependent methyltransferase